MHPHPHPSSFRRTCDFPMRSDHHDEQPIEGGRRALVDIRELARLQRPSPPDRADLREERLTRGNEERDGIRQADACGREPDSQGLDELDGAVERGVGRGGGPGVKVLHQRRDELPPLHPKCLAVSGRHHGERIEGRMVESRPVDW